MAELVSFTGLTDTGGKNTQVLGPQALLPAQNKKGSSKLCTTGCSDFQFVSDHFGSNRSWCLAVEDILSGEWRQKGGDTLESEMCMICKLGKEGI